MISNGSSKSVLRLHVNGESKDVMVRSADTLLHTLREQLGLSGAKNACENGDCGACTVLVNGEPMHSCLCLTVEAINQPITTIEGLMGSPIEQIFVEKWAIQCGYCTPGFILNCHALATKHPDADGEVIEEWMASNLCRCTGYQEIKDAVKTVLKEGIL
ncbi:aerobic-type carbon monoxide dehydrogenase, small subunit CoxS/CutS-like protein [Schinkia azotoformans MEV2011]|uniref:Aerobic-type carbon monoxide dehydrogenase, small subunit CoxS/CutS-like protein n=1 Tax=Schinkia azotoformans MEV2011 TaxID=1348973 RepID=A0A072NFC1_SCHAZ|nr:(2Fe-2S)-binding protein [Schinkia azotoformans]KEF36236.1 aerobic-type carbon monoxide dehydrogenase, small subunit CoxS/CutS-like protein [Schinkia azotoformans MEV2011]MEC1693909.1 (2Fe-2S)-binding protein [Schinkia azotoformans]MEC1718622.1 (2Fe-2S)-binding protein [Schinkia azotoformans]MEC1724746.1 (2Fe-2S)-binding protein [Schinkia azotoformans]MEC1742996.1 (2Fe-2S)-binding protein [Schinkia azotoformans]